MSKKHHITTIDYRSLKRYNPAHSEGLTSAQAEEHKLAGAVNKKSGGLTPSVANIFKKNILTLFNLINILLAAAVMVVNRPDQLLFLGIAFFNICMGVFQEIKAKRSLDKMSVLTKAKAVVVRDGKEKPIPQEEIVLDDIIVVKVGSQVCADAEIIKTDRLEADESLLTGESVRITKEEGDVILSGSYITSGRAYARVSAVGDDSYANNLTAEAKQSVKKTPRLMMTLKRIIMTMTIILIPLGTGLFISNYFIHKDGLESAVLGTTASMLGMMPLGLILLSGVTMTLGAVKLARRKALVQSLPSIETLARTDVLCLDKTGTITDGTLKVERMELYGGEEWEEERVVEIIDRKSVM